MTIQTVTDAIRYVGVDDNTLALFENQYPVQPMGVSYNSYVILDEKIAVMDSVDARAAEEWLSNVARVLEGRSPDYPLKREPLPSEFIAILAAYIKNGDAA